MLGMREWRRLRRCGRSERQSQEYAAGGSESPRRRPESKEKRAIVQRGQEKEGAGRPTGIGSCAIGQLDVCGSAAPECAGISAVHARAKVI